MRDGTGRRHVVEHVEDHAPGQDDETVNFTKYDRRSLTYANSFDTPLTATMIRSIEWFTGKISILHMIRKFEKRGAPTGQAFWRAALDTMGIDLLTPDDQLKNIPADG